MQLISEAIEYNRKAFDAINKVLEKYDINNQVLYFDGHNITSAPGGYFDKIAECDSLEDLGNIFNATEHAFILQEGIYKVGKIYKSCSECQSDFVIDCYNHVQVSNSL